jgi:hypothetical protein
MDVALSRSRVTNFAVGVMFVLLVLSFVGNVAVWWVGVGGVVKAREVEVESGSGYKVRRPPVKVVSATTTATATATTTKVVEYTAVPSGMLSSLPVLDSDSDSYSLGVEEGMGIEHLVVVPGHAVWIGPGLGSGSGSGSGSGGSRMGMGVGMDPGEWVLEGYQTKDAKDAKEGEAEAEGRVRAFVGHVERGCVLSPSFVLVCN